MIRMISRGNGMMTRRGALAGLSATPLLTGLPAFGADMNAVRQTATREGKLAIAMLTSASDDCMRGMIKKFREHYPFLDVSYTLQSTSQLMNHFTAEINAKKGLTDCLMLPANLTETGRYVSSGAVALFAISQDAAFPDNAKRSGFWYALAADRAVTIYRKDALSDEEKKLVRTYKGLGNPRFKGRLGINGITNSVAVTGAYVLQNHPDKSLWARIAANKPHVKTASPGLMDGLLSGEYDVSIFAASATAATAARNGAPIEFGNTALSPTLYVPNAVSALAPHPNAARLWQDWVLSKEGQELWVALAGSGSARNDVSKTWARQQPWFFESSGTHKTIDWADFASKESEVVARFRKDMQSA
jgi:iron(III) transport system substrate-binding protein